ncbi:hypothetical protein B7R54_00490 [Subtercola boreus]|uniref:Aldehyde dehydrogenase domain-containing protein n=1 Tax=Subtercola boreus TaxID=120213 RepID=A0A3E0VEG7_9MICO|nr:aldehyde dehydrogenase family protein [Subtercola boreus]RFA07858.1 hypothetical protein B7R54_00490 [Subtercola boreus]TQL55291.1 RHH-type proline utilization regulon transcriptional repressor/proline dehydrogenase/delta 1-pyrroline-5-carboxylate dehydrogenase [Subtercola boreus]
MVDQKSEERAAETDEGVGGDPRGDRSAGRDGLGSDDPGADGFKADDLEADGLAADDDRDGVNDLGADDPGAGDLGAGDPSADGLGAGAVALVRRWLNESSTPGDTPGDAPARGAAGETGSGPDSAATRLLHVVREPAGLAFVTAFVDGVVRPEDNAVAARNLERLSALTPELFPARLRSAIRVGSTVGEALPWAVVPTSKRVLRRMVGHLVADATPSRLAETIARLTADGSRLNLTQLGEPVLGGAGAASRRDGIRELLVRGNVDRVMFAVPDVAASPSPWAFEEAVERVAEALLPVYELALAGGGAGSAPKMITLDVRRPTDLDLTIAVLQSILSRPQLLSLEAGITLPAGSPEAPAALERLMEWARVRVDAGGAPLTVRIVAGPGLLGLVDAALTPERTESVRVVVAGQNLFDAAYAWLLAAQRGVSDRLAVELQLGVSPGVAAAVRREVGGLVITAPIVAPRDFPVVAADLVKRLGEDARDENLLAEGFDPATDQPVFVRERDRFLASLGESGRPDAGGGLDGAAGSAAHDGLAGADGLAAVDGLAGADGLAAVAPDAASDATSTRAPRRGLDPAVPADRDRAREILARVEGSRLGSETIAAARIFAPATLDALLERAAVAGAQWGAAPAETRSAALRHAGLALEAGRDRLVEVLASEVGTILGEGDSEVSEAVDGAVRFAAAASGLEQVDGARFVPPALIVVRPAAPTPLADAAEGVFSALAAGAAVVLSPPPEVRRASAVFCEVLWEAGIPREVLLLVDLAERAAEGGHPDAAADLATDPAVALPAPAAADAAAADDDDADADDATTDDAATDHDDAHSVAPEPARPVGLTRQLLTDPRVDRVVLTGTYETAELLRSWRPDLPLLASTVGRNAIVVTPSADFDLAVADIVASAFGRAGQGRAAVSLVILVGSAAKSSRFTRQLVDAVTSLKVGAAGDAASEVGPLIHPAEGRVSDALTKLDDDDHRIVEPRQSGDQGLLWSPGVRSGVTAGSPFHLGAPSGPVLGVMQASTLDEALALQNSSDFGWSAGLHSLDPIEVEAWLAGVEAGNLFVNGALAGGASGRHAVGGWKRSSVGPAAQGSGASGDESSAGTGALFRLGTWTTEPGTESTDLTLGALDPKVRELIESATAGLDWRQFDMVRRSALNDEEAWGAVFAARDLGGAPDLGEAPDSGGTRTVLRHRPVPVVVRLSEGEPFDALVRVLAAGTRARASLGLSTALKLPRPLRALLKERRVRVFVENDAAWLERAAKVGDGASRIRMIGGDPRALAEALGGSPDVTVYAGDVTRAGRIELLPFLAPQVVTVAARRFGGASPVAAVRIG